MITKKAMEKLSKAIGIPESYLNHPINLVKEGKQMLHPTTTTLLTDIHAWLENEEPTIDLPTLAKPWVSARWPDRHQDVTEPKTHDSMRHFLHEIWLWLGGDQSFLDLIAMAEDWRAAGCPGSNHKSGDK